MQTVESKKFFVYPVPIVKGICILGIILFHVGQGQLGTKHFCLLTGMGIFANCLSQFAVPLFLMLSGFYLSLNRSNERAIPFYRRTIKYLLIPYCVYSLVYSMPAFLKNGDYLQIAKNLLTASASAHLWFGLLILQLYILHPFLSRWFRARKNPSKAIFLAFVVQITYTLALSMVFKTPDLLALPASVAQRLASIFFVSNIGYFFVGYYLLEKAGDIVGYVQDRRAVIVAGVAYLLAGFSLFLFVGIPISKGILVTATLHTFLAQSVLTPLMSLAAIPFIYPLVQKRNPSQSVLWRILNNFGLYSYGIYYLHTLIYWLVVWIAKRFPIISGVENSLLNLLLFLATASMTLMLVKIVTRLPFGRYVT